MDTLLCLSGFLYEEESPTLDFKKEQSLCEG